MMSKVKMYLFTRWLFIEYTANVVSYKIFNEYWLKEQIEHFDSVVWNMYLENGTVEEARNYLKQIKEDKDEKV